jgi:hypothetical protein
MTEKTEPDVRLVDLENALDEHQRVRRNSHDPAELQRVDNELAELVEELSDDPSAKERALQD